MIDPAIQYENHYREAWDLADRAQELSESYEEFFEEEGVSVDNIIRDALECLARNVVTDEVSRAGSITTLEALLEDIGVDKARAEEIITKFEGGFNVTGAGRV